MFLSYAHLTQTQIPADGGTVAVLPLAAVETHGPHLPLGTDGIIAEGILDTASAVESNGPPVLRLPLVWLGASAEHAGLAGTLSSEPEDLIAQIVAVGQGLSACGVRRIVLFNAHGGNVAAGSIAALKLRTRFGFLAASVHWLDFGLPSSIQPPAPAEGDVHGGWIETSVLLHLAPHLVAREALSPNPNAPQVPAPSLFPSGPIAWGWTIGDLAQGSWIGAPHLASAELGRELVTHAAKELNGLLLELSRAPWPVRQ